MAHEYNDADWEYEIDSAQRAGTTGQTLERRHGAVSEPEATNGDEPHDEHSEKGEDGSDDFGIPAQFQS